MRSVLFALLAVLALLSPQPDAAAAEAATPEQPAPYLAREHYTKYEYRIPMRDGARLFTVVYVPKDDSKRYPFLVVRTPYGVGISNGEESRYGVDRYSAKRSMGPSESFDKAGYIYVFQDVRGRFMSEGQWIEMTPTLDKKTKTDVDESSDMHDTVEWLLKKVPNHNGRVGIWGISYSGFYTLASIIDSHPAIRAASPQAPVTDLYQGDDTYHGGAFMLAANFDFYSAFGVQKNPTDLPRKWPEFDYGGRSDGYDYLLGLGTLANIAGSLPPEQQLLFKDQWQHTTYDDYWKARSLPQYLRKVRCAVLTVGGWFDAEDPQGQFTVFKTLERRSPDLFNALVIGPWVHGGGTNKPGRRIGAVDFGADTGSYYREQIALPFFEHELKDAPDPKLAKATVFETGTNVWRRYSAWPPKQAESRMLYLQPQGGLSWQKPAVASHDDYRSDPARPVPYIAYAATGVPQEYMVSDQRFAASRPDVLVYTTPPLEEDVTVVGAVSPRLFVATSGSDADWVVKLIDVYPDDYPDADDGESGGTGRKDVPPPGLNLAGYQQLVRGEPFRGKYRKGFETPLAFTPGQVEAVGFSMPDINHSFRRGHRIMVQIQSSWFPLIDRNPQTFVDIAQARPEDFKAATQQVFTGGATASGLQLQVLPAP